MASTRYYSNYSSIVSVKTNENKIATPTVSSFTYDETKGFTVKYKSNTTSFTGFEVKILDKNNNQVCYKQTDTKTTSVTLNSSNIKANTKYTVQVKAFNTVNGTKKYSSYASKDLTTPKETADFTISAPTVGDITYYDDCTSSNATDKNGNYTSKNLMFVGETRDISIYNISNSSELLSLDKYNISYDTSVFSIKKNSNSFSVTPLKAVGTSTITISSSNGKYSHKYTCEVIKPISGGMATLEKGSDYVDPTDRLGTVSTVAVYLRQTQFEKDTTLYCLTQITNNYYSWLTNNGYSDSKFNKLLYAYNVVTRNAYDNQDYGSEEYSILYLHRGDCGGFTGTYHWIIKLLGFTNQESFCGVYESSTTYHQFNIVVLDGVRYKVDCDADSWNSTSTSSTYSSFLVSDSIYKCKPYYGFACSSQEEYDNAVAKVKTEFKNAINELNTENGYSLKVVDELPSGARLTDWVELSVSTGFTPSKETLLEYLDYDIWWGQQVGFVHIDDVVSLTDSSTSYTSQGYITYNIYYANNDEKTSNSTKKVQIDNDKITIISDDETEVIENNTNAEDTENSEANEEEPVITPEPTFEPTEDSEVTEDTVSSETDETSEIEIEAETSSETELTDESLTEESN